MPVSRNTQLPQHSYGEQAHYGNIDLNALPDATGYPSGTAFLWDGDEWFYGTVTQGSGSSFFEESVGYVNAIRLIEDKYLIASHDDQAYLYLAGDLVEITDGQDGTVNLDDFNGKVYIASRNGLVIPVLSADPAAPDSEEGQVYYNDSTKTVRVYSGSWGTIGTGGGTDSDEKVKVSSNDTSADYLITQVSGTAGVTVYEYNNGGNEVLVISGSNPIYGAMSIQIDGGGSVLTTGVKGDIRMPFNMDIERASLLADVSGSCVIDIWGDTYANYPPTVADTITAAAKPTLSTAIKSEDTTLTGWSKSRLEGSTLRINVDSATTLTRVELSLKYKRNE